MILSYRASNQITLCKKCSFEPVHLLGHNWESFSQMGKRKGLQISAGGIVREKNPFHHSLNQKPVAISNKNKSVNWRNVDHITRDGLLKVDLITCRQRVQQTKSPQFGN